MPSKKVRRPILLLSLLSSMAFSVISVYAPDDVSDALPYDQPTAQVTREVQQYTAGDGYTLAQAQTETYDQHVPDYEGLRTHALAYAQQRITAMYAQADANWQTSQAAAQKALKKAKTAAAKKAAEKVIATQLPSAKQWACLNNLWTGESGWQVYAVNKDSGAYGIAQALPAKKMAAQGADWRDNYRTQIDWGFTYISSRYGDACKAWDTWQARDPHWY